MRRILRHARLRDGGVAQGGLHLPYARGHQQSAEAEPTAVIVVPPRSARPVPGLPAGDRLRPVLKSSGDDG